jgi:hypothetical protein
MKISKIVVTHARLRPVIYKAAPMSRNKTSWQGLWQLQTWQ